MTPAWVFLGGGAGAVLRWAVGLWVPGPWGVLLINVLGSAALAALAHPAVNASPQTRLFFGTGMLGGFTTYSTFNLDVLTLVQRGRPLEAAALVALTVGGCLAGATASWATLTWWAR